MDLDLALNSFDRAQGPEGVLRVLRDYAQCPLAGCAVWIDGEIESADDAARIALELARLRLSMASPDPTLVDAEAVFARACMRLAELLDASGAWMAYDARARVTGVSSRRL